MANTLMVLGAGKIGQLMAWGWAKSGMGNVQLLDSQPTQAFDTPEIETFQVDLSEPNALSGWSSMPDAVISCLPYYLNPKVAEWAIKNQVAYYDLTEDVAVTQAIQALSANAKQPVMPQCGVAPGFVSIAAQSLISEFETVEGVRMRVGALPAYPYNALKYALTWSTEGLINEYANPCIALVDGKPTALHPLEGLESLTIDGLTYEAFNTSGGLGTLAETHRSSIKSMDYKTLRYPGHCEKMRFLLNDLRLREKQDQLVKLIESAIPHTQQDVVVVYVSVTGMQGERKTEKSLVRKIYPGDVYGESFTAIQRATALSALSVISITLEGSDYHGFVKQEDIQLSAFLDTPFGNLYATPSDQQF